MRPRRLSPVRTGAVALLIAMTLAAPALAQDEGPPRRTAPTSGTTAWFGLPLPPKPGSIPAVVAGPRGPRPVTLPPGEPAAPEFQGAAIRKDLEQLVAIAKESQTNTEIGTGQIWGRIAGFPSGVKTAAWSAEQFKRAGIADVKLQPIAQDAECVVLAAAVVGSEAARRRRVRRRHRPTSCSNRRCRCRRATFPAARSPRRSSMSATAARRCSSTSTSRARSRCSWSSRRRTWCSSATRWCRRRRR